VRAPNYYREILPGQGTFRHWNHLQFEIHPRPCSVIIQCSQYTIVIIVPVSFRLSKVSGLDWIKVVQRTTISLIYGQYLLFALRLRVVCTQPILGLSIIYRKILQRFLPFPFNRLSNLITPRCDPAFEGIWSHIKSITTPPSIFTSVSVRNHLRIVKDIDWNLFSRFIKCFADVESP